jgi:DNA-binding SARP family transcriptional activator
MNRSTQQRVNAVVIVHRLPSAARKSETSMMVRILGPLEVRVAGATIDLGRPKQRALLVRLLMRANQPVPFEQLIDELWSEWPPATARHSIQVYVSGLRRVLNRPSEPTRIETHGRAYALRLREEELDLARVRRLLQRARSELARNQAAAAAAASRRALDHWRGRPLADLDDEPCVRDVVLELEELRLEALELRIDADLAFGSSGELVPELKRLGAEHPAHEGFQARLMLALYRSGRQADALEAYHRARQSLLEELGLEPSSSLKQLQAAILQQDPSLAVEPATMRARR